LNLFQVSISPVRVWKPRPLTFRRYRSSCSKVFLLHLSFCLSIVCISTRSSFSFGIVFFIRLSVCLSSSLVFTISCLSLYLFAHLASSSVFLSAYHLWVLFLVQFCVLYSLIYLSFCLFISSSTYIFLYVNCFHQTQRFLLKQ
jgi:hypothetical protein